MNVTIDSPAREPAIHMAEFSELTQSKSGIEEGTLVDATDVVRAVEVELEVRAGSVPTSVADLLELRSGSVVSLRRPVDSPFELRVGSQVIGYGQLVVVGDNLGIRITKISKMAL
jgi:flagellar motor switch protein FliN/FliY